MTVTMPSDGRVVVVAATARQAVEVTEPRSSKGNPAICGRLRGIGKAREQIDDDFCVRTLNGGRTQEAVIYGAADEPDLRIVVAAPPRATGVRLRTVGRPPIRGEMLPLSGRARIRLAVLIVPVDGLPGAIEITQDNRVHATYRLRENPCESRGRLRFTCQEPIELTRR